MTNNIQLTDKAISAIKQQTHTYLRVGVRGSGCSGFEIVFKFEDTKKDIDLEFDCDGAKVIVDPKSIVLIDGSTVDYTKSLMKSGFKIDIPNAKSCGCGKSYDIKSK